MKAAEREGDAEISAGGKFSIYVTHARTLIELRDEFLSDLHRRLASLDLETKWETRVGKSLAIARAKLELESVLTYWQNIELRGNLTSPRSASPLLKKKEKPEESEEELGDILTKIRTGEKI